MTRSARSFASLLRRVLPALLLVVTLFQLAACTNHKSDSAASTATTQAAPPPLFKGLGTHTRTITTSSPEAQKYFNQALVWTYAFNHDEAIRSYTYAAQLDPNCAMAYWGIALCNGPHINNPVMDEAHSVAAWNALQQARANAGNCTPTEKALIDALSSRYADPSKGTLPFTPVERAPYDKAYAESMASVSAQFPNDTDVGTLYAESLMDTRPWDLYDPKTGEPRPETPVIVATLERVMAADPKHPGANHLYIHAVEASRSPARADAAADRLRTLVPGSGHLVHMPAHIDVRTGRWAAAAEQNRQAAAIDKKYRAISPRQGFYRMYMAHNEHFLSYACMMLGRREEAISAARAMLSGIPADWARDYAPVADAYSAIEIEAFIRFGQWDQMLAMPRPPEFLPITTAFWHFGRATAYNAKGDMTAAEREQTEFRKQVAAIPPDALMAINKAHTVLSIAEDTLAGEIAFRKGDTDEAVRLLRKAVATEDTLLYMEPPDWIQPTRHALGAVLLTSGRVGEAEEVYRADLAVYPENGWSLNGLYQCLAKRDPTSTETAAVKKRFEKAWSHADIPAPHATCLCVPKTK